MDRREPIQTPSRNLPTLDGGSSAWNATARQRPWRAVAPRWGGGTRSGRGKGVRQCEVLRSFTIMRLAPSGVGRVRGVQRGLPGFEAPASCSRPFGGANRASSESSAPGFRQSCPNQARLQHLDRVGGSRAQARTSRRGSGEPRPEAGIGEDALEECTFACSPPSRKAQWVCGPWKNELPLAPSRARGCLGSRPG